MFGDFAALVAVFVQLDFVFGIELVFFRDVIVRLAHLTF